MAGEGGRLYLTEYACQGDSVDIRCARPGDVIRVVRANYGRFSVAICNEEGRTDFSVNCLAPNSFSVMQNRSGGRSQNDSRSCWNGAELILAVIFFYFSNRNTFLC